MRIKSLIKLTFLCRKLCKYFLHSLILTDFLLSIALTALAQNSDSL